MAMIFIGSSTCVICNEVLDKHKAFTGTPPFVPNQLDALHKFSDCGMHVECMHAHPLNEKLQLHLEQYSEALFESRICIVDQQKITSPIDFFCTFFLTSDPSENLFKFNFLVINKKNLDAWTNRDEFIKEVKLFQHAGKWKSFNDYPYLDNLVEEVQLDKLSRAMLNNEQIARQKEWLLKRIAESKKISEYEQECVKKIVDIISEITYENKDVLKERLKYVLKDSGCLASQMLGENLRMFSEYL